MNKGLLTEREKEVIHSLLAERGINKYHLFNVCNEGTSLPGSTYPLEIESLSGEIITSTEVYDFWLDWVDGKYTLGEDDGLWQVRNVGDLYDRDKIIQLQQQLQRERED